MWPRFILRRNPDSKFADFCMSRPVVVRIFSRSESPNDPERSTPLRAPVSIDLHHMRRKRDLAPVELEKRHDPPTIGCSIFSDWLICARSSGVRFS
jgi:hypothetical protein